MTQDEAERAEAEAREPVIGYLYYTAGGDSERLLDAYAEAVRRTERMKAEALVAAAERAISSLAMSGTRGYGGVMLHTPIADCKRIHDELYAALAAYQEGAPK